MKQNWLQRNKAHIASGFEKASLFIEFDAMQRHMRFAYDAINREIKKIEKEVSDSKNALDPEDQAAYEDFIADEYWHAEEVFPKIQWNSELMSLYSLFEVSLNQLCRIVKRKSNYQLKNFVV